MKPLFNAPTDLMAGPIRGGWIIPGEPDRSKFLVAIIGTGQMQSVLAATDVQLLHDWVTASAVVPAAVAGSPSNDGAQ